MKTVFLLLALASVAVSKPYYALPSYQQPLIYATHVVPAYQSVQYLQHPHVSQYKDANQRLYNQLQATVLENPELAERTEPQGEQQTYSNRRLTEVEATLLRQILNFCTRKIRNDYDELA